MGIRVVVLVCVLAACTEPNPRLVFERQAVALAQTTEGGWSPGGAILVGDPNTFTFPAPLSIRIKLIDYDTDPEAPMDLELASVDMIAYGGGPFDIAIAPTCAATACTAQLAINAQGSSMVRVTTTGPHGPEADCFYYALVDATVDAMVLREDLEAQQATCKFGKE